jgi:hypothetical protein
MRPPHLAPKEPMAVFYQTQTKDVNGLRQSFYPLGLRYGHALQSLR